MAWTDTDIANRALGMLGVKAVITSLSSDTSTEAKAVRAVFDMARDSINSEFDWPHSRQVVELSLVSGTASSAYSDHWQYAYRYGTTWKKLLGVVGDDTSDRALTESSKIPYQVISDSAGRLILTDLADASALVLVLPEEGHYPAKYVEALAAKVALMAMPRLASSTREDGDLRQEYESLLSNAKATAANEAGFELPVDTPAIEARRGTIYRRGTRELPE
jgi:hypothetical protein